MRELGPRLNRFFRLRYKRFNRRLTLSKRQQLVVITVVLTFFLLLTQTVPQEYRYPMMLALSAATYLGTAFALREDLRGIEWFSLLSLPTLFTAAVSVYYFLLPVRWLTRIPIAVLYAVGIYALLLTENIYNVAANRTIALLRAAHTVGFLLSLVTAYLLFQTILLTRTNPVLMVGGVGVVSFILLYQSLWTIVLDSTYNKRILTFATGMTVLLMQIAWILTFWPANVTITALFLTICFYVLSGISQQYLQEKLYRRTLVEFAIVAVLIFFIVLAGTNWRFIP